MYRCVKKIFFRPEIFVYLALICLLCVFFILGSRVGYGNSGIVSYYIKLSSSHFLVAGVLLGIALLLRISVFAVKAAAAGINPAAVFSFLNGRLQLRKLFSVLTVGILFFSMLSVLTVMLNIVNVFNSTRLRDELLFSWDMALTGVFPPLALASLQYPFWFIEAIAFCFFNLPVLFAVFGTYIFVARNTLFREAAGAFALSVLIMLAGWLLFPVLSPHDRFITNEYNLSIPAQVQPYVDGYNPQKEIVAVWETIRESREGLEVLPTTAIPSAHVVWGVFLVYYSQRVWKWLLLASVPVVVLSTIGTNLFAAHYFVDVPAGVATAIFAVLAARWLAKKQLEYTNENSIMGKEI